MNLARWMQVVFWPEEDLKALHALEKSLATRLPLSNELRFQADKLADWRGHAKMRKMATTLWPAGFWPKAMSLTDRDMSLEVFAREIYPLTAGIAAKDDADDKKRSLSDALQASVLSECLTLHRQDWAVYKSGYKPRRDMVTPESAAALRKKSSVVSSHHEWGNQ